MNISYVFVGWHMMHVKIVLIRVGFGLAEIFLLFILLVLQYGRALKISCENLSVMKSIGCGTLVVIFYLYIRNIKHAIVYLPELYSEIRPSA